jgi:hypothetical protein
MTPNIDERLASIVRALSEVILPHLPPEASLAQEQVQLCIGHLQILRGQIDAAPAFEREELDDAVALANQLASGITGGSATGTALASLVSTVRDSATATDVRSACSAVHEAIERVVQAVSIDGDTATKARLSEMILQHEETRSLKDRKWCAPFGFDTL